MELLKQRILQEASMLPGNVLCTDTFMSHRIDVRSSTASERSFTVSSARRDR